MIDHAPLSPGGKNYKEKHNDNGSILKAKMTKWLGQCIKSAFKTNSSLTRDLQISFIHPMVN